MCPVCRLPNAVKYAKCSGGLLADSGGLFDTLAYSGGLADSGVLWRTPADFRRTLADSGGLLVVWRTSGGLADFFVAD